MDTDRSARGASTSTLQAPGTDPEGPGSTTSAAPPAPATPTTPAALAELGRRLDLARRRCGLTYRDLEARTGLPRSTLHHLIRGRRRLPDYYLLVGLVGALGESWQDDGWEQLWRAAVEAADAPTEPAGSPAGQTSRRPWPVPQQLPTGLAVFTGRRAALAELDDAAHSDGGAAVTALVGPGGVGKTTSAVHWARAAAASYPDGQLYVDLHGFSPRSDPTEPTTVLRGFITALGVAPESVPAEVDEQAALFRSLVADRRVLVVLDNARDSEQVLPLLPSGQACCALITSRLNLPTLVARGARIIQLGVMPEDEARQVLADRLGRDRVEADADATDTVVRRCGGLPLALAIVAARAGQPTPGNGAAAPDADRSDGLRAAATALGPDSGGLDAFDSGELGTDLRAVLSWSYRLLSDDHARVLRLVAALPAPSLDTEQVVALVGEPPARVATALDTLVGAHLVERVGGRYALHDLVRLLAQESATDTAEAPAAVGRLLAYLLAVADSADRTLSPHRAHALADLSAAPFDSYEDALTWCRDERPVVLAAVRAADVEQADPAWRLPASLWAYYRMGIDWPGYVELATAALELAARAGDVLGEAVTLNCVGVARGSLGDLEASAGALDRALELYLQLPDRRAPGFVMCNLGELQRRLGRPERALEYHRRHLALSRADGYTYGESVALNNIGLIEAELGHREAALDSQRNALGLAEQIGDGDLQADIWSAIGDVHRAAGELGDATAAYARAVDRAEASGADQHRARALTGLAETYLLADDPTSARSHAERADDVLADLDGTDATDLSSRVGAVLAATGPAQ